MNVRPDRFSEKMLKTPPSGIRKFFDLIIGRDDIISLGVGEPDFPTPWLMREEAYYHLEQGHTSYTSNWGPSKNACFPWAFHDWEYCSTMSLAGSMVPFRVAHVPPHRIRTPLASAADRMAWAMG